MLGEQVESLLFSLKAGDLSGVLLGRDGFHILKIEEVKEEKQKSFEEVKDQILQALKKEKGKAEASRKADDAFYSLFRTRDLEGYSREKNIPIKTTGLFKEGDEIPDIGKNPLFYSSAFSLKLGEISPVVSVPPNFYILKLVNKKDSRIPPLNEVKEEVTQKVIETKAEEKARQVAEELLNQIRKGKNIKEVAREKGFHLEETGFFTRTAGVVPKIGPAREWMGILASLTQKNPIPKEVIKTKDGYFVARLSGYESADQNKFQSMKKNLEKRMIYMKQEEAFQNWLEQLKAKGKIDINKDILKG
jgi:peptidyl-prolyl cis-trans isomerase D